MPALDPYAPLQVLKPLAPDLWIVDGPEIDMHYFGLKLPFTTRMTLVRVPSGRLWAHSPIAPDERLSAALDELGPVSFLVAPNTLHYWYLPAWQARYPQARSYGAPGLARRARRPLRIDEDLAGAAPGEWESCFEQCVAPGSLLTEVDFFHTPSRTLILTDLIENFELARVHSAWLRLALRVFGGADPDGTAPRDMRLSFAGHRQELRAAARQMIAWAPERIILAHGRCYETNGSAELERAFRWIL